MRLLTHLLSLLLATGTIASPSGGMPMSDSKYSVKQPPLTTPWTYKAGTNPWPEYPRPQLQRSEWQNLNGIWKYQNASSLDAVNSPPFGQTLAREVLVPSCLESGLSGRVEKFIPLEKMANDLICRDPRQLHPLFMVLNLF